MPICRVIYMPDKSVTILHYQEGHKYSREESFNMTVQKNNWNNLEYEDMDTSELPATREYRNAWEKEKNKPFKLNQVKKDKIDKDKNKKTVEERLTALEQGA